MFIFFSYSSFSSYFYFHYFHFFTPSFSSTASPGVQVLENIQNQRNVLSEIITTCRQGIAAEHGLMLSSVILIRTRTIPKTTSGKIARSWCRRAYLDGTLNILLRWDAYQAELDKKGIDYQVEVDMREIEGMDDNNDIEGTEENVELYKTNIDVVNPDNSIDEHNNKSYKANKTSPNSPSYASTDPNLKYAVIRNEPGYEEIDLQNDVVKEEGLNRNIDNNNNNNRRESVTEIRGKTIDEIIILLEKTLKQIASQSPAPISGDIHRLSSLSSLGLDSFTLVQFKGVLEKRY